MAIKSINWINATTDPGTYPVTYGNTTTTFKYVENWRSPTDDYEYEKGRSMPKIEPKIDSPRWVESYERDDHRHGTRIYWSDGMVEFLPHEKVTQYGSIVRERDEGTHYLREWSSGYREYVPKKPAADYWREGPGSKPMKALSSAKKDPMAWLREQNEAVCKLTRAA